MPGCPVFLLGFPRSGTTLLRLFLDAHSQLAIPFESFVLIEFWHRLPEYPLDTAAGRTRLVDDLLSAKGIRSWNPRVTKDNVDLDRCTTFDATIEQIFGAYARLCGKCRWGDKTPSYTRDFHILHELFPNARFVHLLRDGRDAALSLVRQPWGPSDFVSALSQWNEVVAWSRKMGRCLPATSYMEIRYEDLVRQPEPALRRITDFLELPFEPSMLDAHSDAASKLPERSRTFHPHLGERVDTNHVFGWRERLTNADQAIALRIAGSLLNELGYPTTPVDVTPLQLRARSIWLWGTGGLRWRYRRLRKALGLKRPVTKQPGMVS